MVILPVSNNEGQRYKKYFNKKMINIYIYEKKTKQKKTRTSVKRSKS